MYKLGIRILEVYFKRLFPHIIKDITVHIDYGPVFTKIIILDLVPCSDAGYSI
ncbi:MAG: hypothetical protein RHS_1784 [Robinsoniella sp. RHS]|uniref:hypothetical protein n=1 Tax=Robinsoniella TaxID=588605 RepID=UPI000659F65D|nr:MULTISPECIES: hypothetical protein [Robinsoniella]KLU72543.1 MAG: hypothetical protein RHS_1784 [Robinsoniella sp. RHS]MDU7031832.1 hypothetical protein [Clostridiales bacterium]